MERADPCARARALFSPSNSFLIYTRICTHPTTNTRSLTNKPHKQTFHKRSLSSAHSRANDTTPHHTPHHTTPHHTTHLAGKRANLAARLAREAI
jgi:hypothetical protein